MPSDPLLASVVIRLMMAINDISLVSFSKEDWEETETRSRQPRKRTAQMYFVRLLMSHLYEGLKIIREISESSSLRAAVYICDMRTVEAFLKVDEFRKVKENRNPLDAFRNQVTFHYDDALASEALSKLVSEYPQEAWAASMGTESLDFYFGIADAVVDRTVARRIYSDNMPRSKERAEVIKELASTHEEIARAFTEFAAYFARRHSS